MVRRARLLSIALVIALVTGAVSGQQPKRKREPYIAPLLPAEQAWKITLPAPPSAPAVMDDALVYVPLEATTASDEASPPQSPSLLMALNRKTGAKQWTASNGTRLPPVLADDAVVIATTKGIEAFATKNGERLWNLALDRPVRGPMMDQGSLLLALVEGGELIAIDRARRETVWRTALDASGSVFVAADADAAYVTTAGSRLMRVTLADGVLRWERRLLGELSAPVVDDDRVFVGSSSMRSFWALDARTGSVKWAWHDGVFGGPVVGAAVKGDRVYVVSMDNIVRALDRNSGAQRWKKPAGTRPLFAPRLFEGVVAVTEDSPVLSTFRTDTGAPVSTWTRPERDALLQGPPLIDAPAPYSVSIVVVFRDGQVYGLRSTEMLFKEPPLAPFTVLPGRNVPRETVDAEPRSTR